MKQNKMDDRLTTGLGWFSIGLGLSELLAPRLTGKLAGLENSKSTIRWFGARELATGVGILTQPQPSTWLWARVAGDVIDLVALGKAMQSGKAKPGRAAIATAVVAGVTAMDVYASVRLTKATKASRSIHVTRSIIIDRSPEELYNYWHDFEKLPRFMSHMESVIRTGENRFHWTAKGPVGLSLEWDAEVINDKPGELIAWRSLPGSEIDHSGTVRFEKAVGNRGTIVRVQLLFNQALGGTSLGRVLGKVPEQEIEGNLRRFKQLMETGEIARTEGQPAARESSTSLVYDEIVRA